MNCSCNIDHYDCDTPEFYETEMAKSAVSFLCNECQGEIKKGDTYSFISGKYEGELFNYSHCMDCVSLGSVFNSISREDIDNHLNDCDYEVPESCMVSLTPKARWWVCEIIEAGWTLI